MNLETLEESLLELIRVTSSTLPEDVVRAVNKQHDVEEEGSNAKYALSVIKQNVDLAKEKSAPLCQDTGTNLYFINCPQSFPQLDFIKAAESATIEATKLGYLRQNSVNSLTGKNTGNNLGKGAPCFHFHVWEQEHTEVRFMMKGGGCENVGAQYSLPHTGLDAGRDLEGVRKCILDAVIQAQGKGCGPGILGVCIGGDRGSGYINSKEQFLRKLDDTNSDETLKDLEETIMDQANQLGIGPMGFGGKTTLLGCKIDHINRVPASYFVSVSYMCWAFRRQGISLDIDNKIDQFLY